MFFFLMEKTEEKEWQPFLMWFRAKSLCVMLYFIHGIWVTPYTGFIYKSSLCCFCYWWPVKYLTTIDPNSSKNIIFWWFMHIFSFLFLLILMLYFCSKYSASRILYEYSFLKLINYPTDKWRNQTSLGFLIPLYFGEYLQCSQEGIEE